jgi:predicted nucleotide-binding protein
MASKPRVFIGSSVEGRGIAEHIQGDLENLAECVRWSQGVVGVSESTLESLFVVVKDFDFAILVLTPGDLDSEPIKGRHSPRDNILFELGLFVGALGRGRTFTIHGKDAAMTHTLDFAGLTPLTFMSKGPQDRETALAPVCSLIRSSIQSTFRPRSEPPMLSVSDTMTRMSSDAGSGTTDLAKQTARLRRKIDSVLPAPRRLETERPKKG